MDNRGVFLRIDQQMRKQKKKNKELNEYLGLSRCAYDTWKRGTSNAYMNYIDEISEYLHVSSEYLLNGGEPIERFIELKNQEEEDFILSIRRLSDDEVLFMSKILEAYISPKNMT